MLPPPYLLLLRSSPSSPDFSATSPAAPYVLGVAPPRKPSEQIRPRRRRRLALAPVPARRRARRFEKVRELHNIAVNHFQHRPGTGLFDKVERGDSVQRKMELFSPLRGLHTLVARFPTNSIDVDRNILANLR